MKKKKLPIVLNGRAFDFSCPHQMQCRKKRFEFSKIAVVVITLFCMGCVTANYVLAFRNAQNINSEVTITLVGTILGTVLGYFGKSFSEKNSRNIYQKKESAEDDRG